VLGRDGSVLSSWRYQLISQEVVWSKAGRTDNLVHIWLNDLFYLLRVLVGDNVDVQVT
jgi:hypothetical protein